MPARYKRWRPFGQSEGSLRRCEDIRKQQGSADALLAVQKVKKLANQAPQAVLQ